MIAVLIAGAVGMLVSLAGTRALISFFQRLGKGQPILGAEDHGPAHQMAKQGTPTMGGIAILLAGFIGWLVGVGAFGFAAHRPHQQLAQGHARQCARSICDQCSTRSNGSISKVASANRRSKLRLVPHDSGSLGGHQWQVCQPTRLHRRTSQAIG